MWQLLTENVRCFQQAQSSPIRPITVLVGENSSGKTTFLALVRMAWELVQGRLEHDLFNEEPFLLGSYDQIASLSGSKAGSAKSFVVGMELSAGASPQDKVTVSTRFVSLNAQPKLEEWVLQAGDSRIEVQVGERSEVLSAKVVTSHRTQEIDTHQRRFSPQYVLRDVLSTLESQIEKEALSESGLESFKAISDQPLALMGRRPIAFAPIRTRPQRKGEGAKGRKGETDYGMTTLPFRPLAPSPHRPIAEARPRCPQARRVTCSYAFIPTLVV
jgi:hypothetical protein